MSCCVCTPVAASARTTKHLSRACDGTTRRGRALARAAERAAAAVTGPAQEALLATPPRRRPEASAAADTPDEEEDEHGLTALEQFRAEQMAFSALRALPAWLAPFEGAARDVPTAADPPLLSLDDDAMGDAGLALWLAMRPRR